MAAAGESDGDPSLREIEHRDTEEQATEAAHHLQGNGTASEEENEDDGNEEDEREPTLKYTKLTSYLASIYRNGDSASSFQLSGDKLITGTHNGIVHVLSIPSLHSLRQYRAHSSSITAISISPFAQSLFQNADVPKRSTGAQNLTPKRQPPVTSSASPKSPIRTPLPATPSNLIYIATASIDGQVCVSSLVDATDVTLRNYARPVHAVALSPAFKTDRTYLSGGTAGNLICTVGGKIGVSSDANTNSAAAAASGWLGSIGLGSSSGKDIVLHSGEGTVAAIKWSTSGKYVAWNNEFGTRIMHSHIDAEDSDLAWKRINYVAHPNRKEWEDMAGVWKAQTQWIEEKFIEQDDENSGTTNGAKKTTTDVSDPSTKPDQSLARPAARQTKKRVERLLVGWGDTAWVIHVTAGTPTQGRPRPPANAEVVHQIRFDDCIISGLTLYTPSILVALCFRTLDDNDNPISTASQGTPRRGRHNGLPPELRLIDLKSANKDGDQDELEVESVIVSRFESLSFADYHLSTLYIPKSQAPIADQKGTLEILGGSLLEVGASATRLFSSSASILSGSSGDHTTTGSMSSSGPMSQLKSPPRETLKEAPRALLTVGLKIFIQSSFDCVVAVKRDIGDHLDWLLAREEFEAAWNLVKSHPEIITTSRAPDTRPSTPTRSHASLVDFFDDSASHSTVSTSQRNVLGRVENEAVEFELQRIGDLWVNKLVEDKEWATAGRVAGKTLGSSHKWEDWILSFARNGRFDEITPFIPTDRLKPALPSHVYDVILGHYITHDRLQLEDLLDKWSSSMFDVSSIILHIKSYLETGKVRADSDEGGVRGRDWNILMNALAKLYLADGRPAEAVHCYLKTKNSDATLEVIRDYSKIDAIANDVYAFILIRVSLAQQVHASMWELDELSSEPIRMLASAAVQGTIEASSVVAQLQAKAPASDPYLFFYFRELWRSSEWSAVVPARSTAMVGRSRFAQVDAAETPSRALLAPYADEVVSLFAEYSQQLLNDFLKTTEDYTFEHASDECRRRNYIPELVHLLSVTGETKSALRLIIDELQDVSMAISYVQGRDEESLWSDLLDYSIDKPVFIRGLLEDVGTSRDPVKLVQRIPEGLQIDGLKDSLAKLVRENEITWSISEGAARILRGEIAGNMDRLRGRRERGFVYETSAASREGQTQEHSQETLETSHDLATTGVCAACLTPYGRFEGTTEDQSNEHLIGFACGHLYHLSCFLDSIEDDANKERLEKLRRELPTIDVAGNDPLNGVGLKIREAQMIKIAIGKMGCLKCSELNKSRAIGLGD